MLDEKTLLNLDVLNLELKLKETTVQINNLKRGILYQLLYSEIFNHPLTAEELYHFIPEKANLELSEFTGVLNEMEQEDLIQCSENFYFVFEKGNKISERQVGSEKAKSLMPKAHKMAHFINGFPFIEGVGISGSLSKGVLHDDGDFDFFIITKPNRLWVARTLLILYKKVFLLNSRKYFCVNYFVDSENMEIEEKNRFTAVEISTLIPASGKAINSFFDQNIWIDSYFPNRKNMSVESIRHNKPVWSKFLHWTMRGRFGEWMDERMMRLTFKRWKKKFGEFNDGKFDLTMKTRKYVSKHHPNDFQNKVLKKHTDLIETYKLDKVEQLQNVEIEL